jgi:hypothetical protein
MRRRLTKVKRSCKAARSQLVVLLASDSTWSLPLGMFVSLPTPCRRSYRTIVFRCGRFRSFCSTRVRTAENKRQLAPHQRTRTGGPIRGASCSPPSYLTNGGRVLLDAVAATVSVWRRGNRRRYPAGGVSQTFITTSCMIGIINLELFKLSSQVGHQQAETCTFFNKIKHPLWRPVPESGC